MKITQLRGDLAAFRNLELSIVLNAMKTENSRKPDEKTLLYTIQEEGPKDGPADGISVRAGRHVSSRSGYRCPRAIFVCIVNCTPFFTRSSLPKCI